MDDRAQISERPAEVEDRAVPGHWEGDLLIGSGRSQIATLVERSTRFVCSAAPKAAPPTVVEPWPPTLMTSARAAAPLTGSGINGPRDGSSRPVQRPHRVSLLATPSPWQRGWNENANGLLRQYFPRSATDFG